MRAIIILLLTLILSINLYTQDSTPTANENALMRINKFEARKNPVSFINIVLFTPYPTLLEYARINGIEIYHIIIDCSSTSDRLVQHTGRPVRLYLRHHPRFPVHRGRGG